jgi:hypothetical protein
MYRRCALGMFCALFLPFVPNARVMTVQTPDDPSCKIEIRIFPEKNIIHPGDAIALRVEIWNVGREDTIIAQNVESTYINASLNLYLEVGNHLQGSQAGSAADSFPDPEPDVAKTFVNNWLTLRRNHYYGTTIYMDAREFPQLEKPGGYRVKARYVSGGITSNRSSNSARLNQEDIDKLPFKAWAGTVDSDFMKIQVVRPTRSK